MSIIAQLVIGLTPKQLPWNLSFNDDVPAELNPLREKQHANLFKISVVFSE